MTPNQSVGYSVSNAGDVNGDGIDDVIIGAPATDLGEPSVGAAYLFYGPVTEQFDVSQANVTISGNRRFDRAGHDVSTAGDLNNDGFADIVVGVPGDDTTVPNAGAAYVLFGGQSLPERMTVEETDVVLVGTDNVGHAGWSVSDANDVDGFDGVIVGAPLEDGEAGTAYVLSSNDIVGEETVRLVAEQTTAMLNGESQIDGGRGDRAGWAVSNAGDVNGDGMDDIIVGANFWTPTGEHEQSQSYRAGAAYIVYGPVAGQTNLQNADVRIRGVNAMGRAGWSVSDAGDLNDDGYADVVVGVPFAVPSDSSVGGRSYVLYGGPQLSGDVPITEANLTLTGAEPGDRAGYDVSSTGSGDVTCDGVSDLLIGAPGSDVGGQNAGAVYVVAGSPSRSGLLSLANASWRIAGAVVDQRAGYSVSSAGDVNGEEPSEVLLGAPLFDRRNAPEAGAAYIASSECYDRPHSEPGPGSNSGGVAPDATGVEHRSSFSDPPPALNWLIRFFGFSQAA